MCYIEEHMGTTVGIRALKQNASAVVRMAARGDVVIITDHGREVAQLTAMPASILDRLEATGRLRRARKDAKSLPPPKPGPPLTDVLLEMREGERY